MLKIKDNSKFDEIVNKYDLDYDADSDYESGIHYAIYCKGGVTFDVSRCHNELKQDDILIEICKFMQMQINRLEKDNKNIKRELNRLKRKTKK